MPTGRTRNLVKSTLGLAFSRGVGLVFAMAVSMLLANRLGAGAQTDAFFFARRITTGLAEVGYRVVGIVLIPGLVVALQMGAAGGAKKLYHRHLGRILLWSLLGTVACSLLAPWIVRFLGPGLQGETAATTVHVIRIMFFLIPTTLFLAVSTSLLNAGRIYGMPSAMAQLSRFLVVMSLVFFVPPWGVSFLAWVMLAGSVGAGLILAGMTERHLPGMELSLTVDKPAAGLGSGNLLWAGLIFFGVGQFSVWIDFGFASTLGIGKLSVLEYGYRFMGILPGLMSASLNTVMYTEFAHKSAQGDLAELQRSLARSARAGLFIIAPVVGFMGFQGQSLMELFLRHGEFAAETAVASGQIMLLTGPGLALSFISRMFVFGMYTDKRLPHLKFTLVTMTVSLLAQFGLVALFSRHFGIAGVALGSSLGSIIMLLVVFAGLYRLWGRFIKLADLRALALVLVMTAVAMGGARWLDLQLGLTAGPGLVGKAGGLALVGVLGMGGFLGLAALMKLPELKVALSFLRRRTG